MARLILASRSPQRTAILDQLGVEHVVAPTDAGELEAGDPLEVAAENARRKARAAIGRTDPAATVLGVDTVVALHGRILPKPGNEARARDWLDALSGARHRVIGGLCVIDDAGGERSAVSVTEVTFRALSPELVDWYLASGEWRERAGGYAIQGRGAALVQRIEGDYLNVVGLPVPSLLELLPELLGG